VRALVYTNNSLSFEQNHPNPAPIEGEALIRVLQAGICNTDLEIVRGYMDYQGILGHEFVGSVEEIYGHQAQERYGHLIGRRIVGEINAACHRPDCPACQNNMLTHCPNRTTLGIVKRNGAFADYLTLPVENLHPVPDNITDEEAVFVEPLAANFEILEQVYIHPTDRAIILGDGKMGQLAAQVLALTGCEVTMLGKHEEKLALAARHGISTLLLKAMVETQFIAPTSRVDLVVECTGSPQGLELAMRLVRPRADKSTVHLVSIVIDEIRIQGSRCGPFAPALRALSTLRVDVRPLISARYTFDNAIEAFEFASKSGVLKVLVRL